MRIISKIKGITLEIGGDVTPLQKGIRSLNTETNSLQRELRGVETLLKMSPKSVELLQQKQELLNKAIGETKSKLEILRDAKERIDRDMANGTEVNEKEYRNLQREIAFTEGKLKELEGTLKSTSASWESASASLEKFGTKSVEVGNDLTKKVTAPIVGVGVAVTKMASDFTDALAKVSTLADTQVVSMDELKGGILDISNATGIASREITESVYGALSAGVETGEVLDFIAANTGLVRAGFTDMGTAVDLTTSTMNAYGDQADSIEVITDKLVKTQDKGKITVGEMGQAFGKVIPTAAGLNVDLGQLGASFAVLTAKAVPVQQASTGLNAMFLELGKTGSGVDEVLRELTGKGFQGLIDEGKTVGEVLELLGEFAGNSELRLSELFGSANAGAMAFTLAGNGADAFNDVLLEINDSSGTVAENLEKLETPSQKLAVALNAIKNAGIELGVMLLPVLEAIAKAIQSLADGFGKLTDSQKKTILIVGGLLAAIGPLLIVIGKISLGISAIIKAGLALSPVIAGLGGVSGIAAIGVGALGTAIAFLTSPIGLVIVAITAVVGAITWLARKFKKSKEDIVEDSDDVAKKVERSMDLINNPESAYDEYFNVGEDINLGLEKGILSNGDLPLDAIDKQSQALTDKVKENIAELDTFGSAISKALTNQYKEMQNEQILAIDSRVKNEREASSQVIESIRETLKNEKSILNERLSVLKSSTNERIKEYQRDYDNRMQFLNKDTDSKVDGIQGQIDAIDEEGRKEKVALDKRQINQEIFRLQATRNSMKTIEDVKELNEKIRKLKQEHYTLQADEERTSNKNKLKAQMEQIKSEAKIKQEALAKELEEKKEAEKVKLEEQEKAIKTQLETLQKNSEDKIAIEKQRIDSNLEMLAVEKGLIQSHFQDLLKTENITAEARELIIKGNNDDIITLLSKYNPKWQDAGQGFGDSIVNGLNSKKESMHKAIRELMKIPTVQIKAEYSLNDVSSNANSIAKPSVSENANKATQENKNMVTELKDISNKLWLNKNDDSTRILGDILSTLGKPSETQQDAVFKIGEIEFAKAVVKTVRQYEKQTGKPILL